MTKLSGHKANNFFENKHLLKTFVFLPHAVHSPLYEGLYATLEKRLRIMIQTQLYTSCYFHLWLLPEKSAYYINIGCHLFITTSF